LDYLELRKKAKLILSTAEERAGKKDL